MTGNYNIPIAKPCFTGEETELIAEVMKTGWVCQGPMVARFEEAVAKYTGAKHAVAVSSCTTALHLAMLVNGIGVGDDVICPSYSFIATANGIKHAGAEPQFVDIDPCTGNIDIQATERFILKNYDASMYNRATGNKLKGILIVHQIGMPADIDSFNDLAVKYGLILMEDSACGIGSRYKGMPIGASGFVGTLSFHPRKVISSGEGGMVLTNDEVISEKSRVLRAHGASVSDFARHKAAGAITETYNVIGYNYRMTDLQAAIGIKQMEHLDSFIERRRSVAARYNKAFGEMEEFELLTPPPYATLWNYQSYPLRLKNGGAEERNNLMQQLQSSGVSSRRGIPPIHKEPVYERGLTLPNTESVSERTLFLPIYPQLTDDEVEHVISSVRSIIRSSVPLRSPSVAPLK
jgi:dTDP-4-amino-4,6-dideoxygalactose transaminase